MFENPLVTIIIPLFNHDKYISRCIESVLNQTYKNIELIVVDNGSTDNSYNEAIKYAGGNNFKLISLKENIAPGGINSPVSAALKVAQGKYISLLYSDDWYMPEKIEKQVLCMLNAYSSVGVVYCHGFRYSELTGCMSKWTMGTSRGYVFIEYLQNGDLVIPISPLVKRCCYELIGENHPWTGSEFDFFAMSQFVDFDYVDDHLVVMRDHQSNDAKNIASVYARICRFNAEFFLSDSTKKRAGKFASIRLSNTYLMFSRDFAEVGDRKSALAAFVKALSSRPLCLLSVRGIIIAMYASFPTWMFFRIMHFFRGLRTISRYVSNSIIRLTT